MKKYIVSLLMATATIVSAGDLLGKLTLAPVGAVQTANLNGESQWGAGVDLGYKVNNFVGIHVVNLAFEGRNSCEQPWGGSVVDETDLLIRADITKWKINTFTPYFIGGGLYDWNRDAFGLSVGLGGQINFTKNVGLGADYSIQFLEEGTKQSLIKAYLGFSF
jgi:hypothetical protein